MQYNINYDDIINTPWPAPSSRKKMPMNQRAKIFLPFAALTGFEKLIEEAKIESVKKLEDPSENRIYFEEDFYEGNFSDEEEFNIQDNI